MNILFLLKSFEIGGLEVVSAVLANKFVQEGHNVSVVAFRQAEHSVEGRLNKKVHTYLLSQLKYDKENVLIMKAILLKEQTQIIINQWGLPLVPIKVAYKASYGLNIKIISVFHNNPSFNGRIQNVQVEIERTSHFLKRVLLQIKRKLFSEITSYGMRYNYKHSDIYMVLSPSFIDEFKKFSKIKYPDHLIVQTNPVTIDTSGFSYTEEYKRTEVLYVGRLDYMQKRVSRIIDTWVIIEKEYKNWHLSLIGVGEEKESLEKQVNLLGLKNVSFEGYQQPRPYYEYASILVLTSEFEGFPLVLAEAMSFGVIPVVYDSYPAVHDIVRNGKNGMIVEPVNGKFAVNKMAKALTTIINDTDKRNQMAHEAMNTAKNYSIDTIYGQWLKIFEQLQVE